jgi:dihydropteroate synthase
MTVLHCGGHELDLGRTAIMGILNITPDSFSDGGVFMDADKALYHVQAMVDAGADLIDIGGESTRPGADPVGAQQELDRVMPVLEQIVANIGVPVSIDTSKPEVMRQAAAAGAGMINDVYALRADGALQAASETGLPVCLMHMQGEPRTMQRNPVYADLVSDVSCFLNERVDAAVAAGIGRERIVVDPGFGFGKTLDHNLELLRRLSELKSLGLPILAGISRKSMIQMALGLPVDRRLNASLALAVIAVLEGASILRVHDVGATIEAVRMLEAVYNAENRSSIGDNN